MKGENGGMAWTVEKQAYLLLLQLLEHHFRVLPLVVAMDTPLRGDLRRLISITIK